MHSKGEKTILCTICGKGFIFAESCRAHEGKHERFPCHICARPMNSRYALRDHLAAIHNLSESQNVCEICGYTTPSKKQIRKHTREKHEAKNRHKCPHCDYQSPKLFMIHIHIDSKHSNCDEKKVFWALVVKSFLIIAHFIICVQLTQHVT